MMRVAALLFVLAVGISAVPLEQHDNKPYRIVPFTADIQFEDTPVRKEYETELNGDTRSTVESPWTGTIPSDNGAGNYGDLEFYSTTNNGELYLRETIINGNTNQNVLIYYSRTLPAGRTIRDVKFLNFGRQRGYVRSASFTAASRFIEAEILVAAGNEIRMFVEIYTN